MTNRTRIVLLLLIGAVAVWLGYSMWTASLSHQLRAYGFNKDDIVHEEGYVFDDAKNEVTKVMLLASEGKLGLVQLKKRPLWGWETVPMGMVAPDPKDGDYVMTMAASMKLNWAKFYSVSHLFVARYVDAFDPGSGPIGDRRPPAITGTDGFYLNVDYFPSGNRTLLFGHAMNAEPNDGLSSVPVTAHIDNELKKQLGR